MPLTKIKLDVHLKHYKDGYPLCWDQDEMGTFEGTHEEKDVTCQDCIDYLKETD